MSSSNYSIHRAITGMPSGPEEEDSFYVDRAARSSTVVMGPVTFKGSNFEGSGETVITCCCCCRPHSTNVLPAESSTRNHVAASSLSPQVARKGSTLSGFVQRSRLEREVGRDLHSNKWEEV